MKQGLMPQGYTRFDIVDGWYWWLMEHHTGQWSDAYARLSQLSRLYKPSYTANGPTGEVAQSIYDTLCDKHNCHHYNTTRS